MVTVLCVFVLLIAIISSLKTIFTPYICKTFPTRLFIGREDESKQIRTSQGEIMPYEDLFSRDSNELVKRIEQELQNRRKNNRDEMKEQETEVKATVSKKESISDNSGTFNLNLPHVVKPAQYNVIDEDDDDDPDWVPSRDEDSNAIVNWFKDIYIGSVYDSTERKQARYVVTNITLISISIGVIFTIIWYAFPGKFISFRGDTDFTQRYDTIGSSYQPPTPLE
jgi:hypothetical protein